METLKALFADNRVRAALVALAMAIGAYFGFGCSGALNATQIRALAAHDCYHKALEPVLGPLTDEFLRAALAGGDLGKALLVHGVPPEELMAAASAFEGCGRAAVQASQPLTVPAQL